LNVSIVRLPAPCFAAAADGRAVWCATGHRLLAFESAGALRLDVGVTPGLRSLGVAGMMVAATLDPGVVAWIDPHSGEVARRVPIGGEPTLVSGGGAIWMVDAASGRAWQLMEAGMLTDPIVVAGVDRAAADGPQLWWTSRYDSLLRSMAASVDIGAAAEERGGMVVCAGSVWISRSAGLVRINAWSGELGHLLHAPGLFQDLLCGDGVLVGGSVEHGLFALDPSIDANLRSIEPKIGPAPYLIVATRATVWIFPAERSEAHVVPFRPT
jgi:hypothetical protein